MDNVVSLLRPGEQRHAFDLVNVEVEQALLAAVLIDGKRAYHRIADELRPGDFGYDVHGQIFAAIVEMADRGEQPNIVTLQHLLGHELAAIGGPKRLTEAPHMIQNVPNYSRVIKDLAKRRALAAALEDISARVANPSETAERLFGELEAQMRAVEDRRSGSVLVDPTVLEGEAIPDRKWIVADWIPWGVVTGLYGDPGLGKTLAAMQLQTSAATGSPWLGLRVARVKSLAVLCEDPAEELHRRQADINESYGRSFEDLSDVRWMPRLGCDNLLMTFDHGIPTLTPFFFQVLRQAKEFGAKLVIIDTVADTFGGNENDRGQVRQFVQGCLGRLAREIDGAVVALAHPSRSGKSEGTGESGSTGWDATFRSRLYLSAGEAQEDGPPDPDARILARKKANYAAREERLDLRWQAGALVADRPASGIYGTIERRAAERVFLDLLDATTREGRPVSDKPNAGNFAPRAFSRRPDRERYGKADFHRAMERLFAAGQIVVEQFRGANRHPYSAIRRAQNDE